MFEQMKNLKDKAMNKAVEAKNAAMNKATEVKAAAMEKTSEFKSDATSTFDGFTSQISDMKTKAADKASEVLIGKSAYEGETEEERGERIDETKQAAKTLAVGALALGAVAGVYGMANSGKGQRVVRKFDMDSYLRGRHNAAKEADPRFRESAVKAFDSVYGPNSSSGRYVRSEIV